MKQYIHLLQEFLALGHYDTSYLKSGDTDLVSLKENENLLVIFNNDGDEDLFMIFDDEGVTITFGQWFEFLHGTDFSTFEYLVQIIKEILAGNYYVKEVRLDDIEFALLVSEDTDQVINSCIISGAEELKSMSAFDFLQGLDYSEAYFDEVHWSVSAEDVSDEFYWWDEEDEEESNPENENVQPENPYEHEHSHECSCGHCH